MMSLLLQSSSFAPFRFLWKWGVAVDCEGLWLAMDVHK